MNDSNNSFLNLFKNKYIRDQIFSYLKYHRTGYYLFYNSKIHHGLDELSIVDIFKTKNQYIILDALNRYRYTLGRAPIPDPYNINPGSVRVYGESAYYTNYNHWIDNIRIPFDALRDFNDQVKDYIVHQILDLFGTEYVCPHTVLKEFGFSLSRIELLDKYATVKNTCFKYATHNFFQINRDEEVFLWMIKKQRLLVGSSQADFKYLVNQPFFLKNRDSFRLAKEWDDLKFIHFLLIKGLDNPEYQEGVLVDLFRWVISLCPEFNHQPSLANKIKKTTKTGRLYGIQVSIDYEFFQKSLQICRFAFGSVELFQFTIKHFGAHLKSVLSKPHDMRVTVYLNNFEFVKLFCHQEPLYWISNPKMYQIYISDDQNSIALLKKHKLVYKIDGSRPNVTSKQQQELDDFQEFIQLLDQYQPHYLYDQFFINPHQDYDYEYFIKILDSIENTDKEASIIWQALERAYYYLYKATRAQKPNAIKIVELIKRKYFELGEKGHPHPPINHWKLIFLQDPQFYSKLQYDFKEQDPIQCKLIIFKESLKKNEIGMLKYIIDNLDAEQHTAFIKEMPGIMIDFFNEVKRKHIITLKPFFYLSQVFSKHIDIFSIIDQIDIVEKISFESLNTEIIKTMLLSNGGFRFFKGENQEKEIEIQSRIELYFSKLLKLFPDSKSKQAVLLKSFKFKGSSGDRDHVWNLGVTKESIIPLLTVAKQIGYDRFMRFYNSHQDTFRRLVTDLYHCSDYEIFVDVANDCKALIKNTSFQQLFKYCTDPRVFKHYLKEMNVYSIVFSDLDPKILATKPIEFVSVYLERLSQNPNFAILNNPLYDIDTILNLGRMDIAIEYCKWMNPTRVQYTRGTRAKFPVHSLESKYRIFEYFHHNLLSQFPQHPVPKLYAMYFDQSVYKTCACLEFAYSLFGNKMSIDINQQITVFMSKGDERGLQLLHTLKSEGLVLKLRQPTAISAQLMLSTLPAMTLAVEKLGVQTTRLQISDDIHHTDVQCLQYIYHVNPSIEVTPDATNQLFRNASPQVIKYLVLEKNWKFKGSVQYSLLTNDDQVFLFYQSLYQQQNLENQYKFIFVDKNLRNEVLVHYFLTNPIQELKDKILNTLHEKKRSLPPSFKNKLNKRYSLSL
ncbi:hypothetical protein CYY_003624 [Polysphondylium violaceum]|uniref:Uncharacterized protein n=1 Tax=Polysphondylium violaceum TaxID=133409 RepID=A0A8J4PYU5_9MYCE|nr:hypothetical protein CYY_003624 [Polysphondylium violaceum]